MKLRDLLQQLERGGELVKIKREVDPRFEAANLLHSLKERPVIFENVKDCPMPVFAGICSSRELIARGLGTDSSDLLKLLTGALANPQEPPKTANAPCQEVVLHDIDLFTLPILTHLPSDGGRYTTASVIILKDGETGSNASYHRMMQRDNCTLTARMIKNRQARTTYDRTEGDLEVAVCIGSSMPVLVAASLSPKPGVDELFVANAIEPTPVVRCKTVDLHVPADTEIVLEGRITKDTDVEGPFLDLTGTLDMVRQEPVVKVDCVTMRKDAMYQALLPGGLEHKMLMGMPKEPTIFRQVSQVAKCKNVHVTMGGGSWLHAAVQVEGKCDVEKVIEASFQGHPSLKHVWVVDEDVNIFDPTSIEWAMATRFQGGRDFYLYKNRPGSSLDPSAKEGEKSTTDKAGFDATIKKSREKYRKISYQEVDTNAYIG
ncbi:MAG TPA: UbiD family decarboxylase [Euryarchaeota archaeon]|nr:UbiD family decarboxylase [Euryarchaeota archaeon]